MSNIESRLPEIFRQRRFHMGDITGNLVSAAEGKDVDSVYVTSAQPGEGKTTMSVGMAYGLAATVKQKIALVEANMGSPVFARAFDLPPDSPGFYDYLLGKAEQGEITHSIGDEDPFVISAGSPESRDAWLETYEDESYVERLKELVAHYAYAVFDGDSVLATTGSTIAVRQFDATVLTVRCGYTKWQVASVARDKLKGYGANLLGVALNRRQYPIPKAIYSRV